MKTHHLLLALTVGVVGIAATKPSWLVQPQPTQIAQSAPVADNSSSQANPQTAQAVAAQVTVRIRVGQGLGSGVLLGKKGNTYLVLTNAHVVREQAGISIQTPDGQSYTAQRVKDLQVGNFDVALLEFTSDRAYKLAKIDSSRDNFALKEGTKLFAAGFPRDANAFKFVAGTVKQLPQEPFVNGTQVGYTTTGDIEQGMSGGPILDAAGNLVGINSTYAYPIKPVYTYTDGTKAPADKVAEYRQANWGVPIYNLLTRLNPDILYSYKQLPKLHRTVTPTGYMAELDRKARLVTVRIENSGGNGSGVIVARDGDSYYVLTAEHVVKNTQNLRVTTHDQRTYTIDPSEIKRSGGTDLAIVKFTSTQPYQVATLGNYRVSNGALVFPGGWPAPTKIGGQQWQWQLNPGTIRSKQQGEFTTQDKLSFRNGYDLIYNSNTYGGMSGGPVFDTAGQVIGIHGKAEGDLLTKNVLGQSLGMSIKIFLGLADRLSVKQHNLQIANTAPGNLNNLQLASITLVLNNIANPNDSINPDRWIEYGNRLYRLGKHADAAKAFDRAIKLAPDSLDAYYGEGLALAGNASYGEGLALGNNDYSAALKAIDRAIELVPKGHESELYYLWKYRSVMLRNSKKHQEALVAISDAIRLEGKELPDINLLNEKANLLGELKQYSNAIEIYNQIIARGEKSWVYSNRGNIKAESGDKKGAIADYDRAIAIDSQYTAAYSSRGIVKSELGDKKGAIADFNLAIAIDPLDSTAYYNLGIVKSELGDKKGAIADYDRAIAINPLDTKNYYNLGVVKSELGDKKGAIAAFNRAIAIDPQSAKNYYNLGVVKSELGDKKGAIDDYDRAIAIDPLDIKSYYNRGNIKSELGDKKSAISDFDRAISINPQNAYFYYNRGLAKSELGDKKSAIPDYDRAISINPQFAIAYSNRGTIKAESGDKKGAMADFDRAISINPQFATAYSNRGNVKSESGDKKSAISDYDQAIAIDSQLALAYVNRGSAKYALGDRQGAIADMNIAAQLSKSQNNLALYDMTTSLIQQISN
jgi:tetratricopeptide (TPR) repeat protein/S1-C subfamily serine protease